MNKDQFLEELAGLLADINPSEREEALAYYRQYFEDANLEEEQVIRQLGSARSVADSIREELADKELTVLERDDNRGDTPQDDHVDSPKDGYGDSWKDSRRDDRENGKSEHGGITTALYIVLGILAIPLLLPLVCVIWWRPFSSGVRVDDTKYGVENGFIASKEQVRNLEIDLDAGEFSVKASEDDKIYVTILNTTAFDYGVDETHTLYVRDHNGKATGIGAGKITLYLPAKMEFETALIDVGGGEMEIPSMNAETLEISLGAGNVDFEALQAERVSISLGAGEIHIAQGEVKNLDVDVAAGEAYYAGSIGTDCTASVSMGELNMILDEKEEDFDYELDCGMGEMSIGSISSTGLAFERSIHEGRDKKLEVSCSMGTVNVSFDR